MENRPVERIVLYAFLVSKAKNTYCLFLVMGTSFRLLFSNLRYGFMRVFFNTALHTYGNVHNGGVFLNFALCLLFHILYSHGLHILSTRYEFPH